MDLRIRRLVVHQDENFGERGMSIAITWNPRPSTPLGFSARVTPAWGGETMSGAEALWSRDTMGGLAPNAMLGTGGNRLDTEVAYGLPMGRRFVRTPRAGVRTSDYGRNYRIGYTVGCAEPGGASPCTSASTPNGRKAPGSRCRKRARTRITL